MSDEVLDTETDEAQQEVSEEVAEVETAPEAEVKPEAESDGLDEKTKQYMNSWMGRKVKERTADLEKQVQELKDALFANLSNKGEAPGKAQSLEELNEKLQTRIFDGDIMGAIDEALRLREQSFANISKQKQAMMEKEMLQFADDDNYEAYFPEMEKLATQYLSENKNMPVRYAVEHARTVAELNLLKNKSKKTAPLRVLGGGKTKPAGKQFRLPPEVAKNAARDIASGLYKDEAEWVAALPPAIKKKLAG